MSTKQEQVKQWMLENYSDYINCGTGEISIDQLAEGASDQFGLYDEELNALEWIVDMAEEVSITLGV